MLLALHRAHARFREAHGARPRWPAGGGTGCFAVVLWRGGHHNGGRTGRERNRGHTRRSVAAPRGRGARAFSGPARTPGLPDAPAGLRAASSPAALRCLPLVHFETHHFGAGGRQQVACFPLLVVPVALRRSTANLPRRLICPALAKPCGARPWTPTPPPPPPGTAPSILPPARAAWATRAPQAPGEGGRGGGVGGPPLFYPQAAQAQAPYACRYP